jgi:hypothetical protein
MRDRPPRGGGGGRLPAAAPPGIVRELLAGGSVVCDPTEVDQAIAWARARPAWTDDPPPMYAVDPEIR